MSKLHQSLLMRAYRGEKTSVTPCWFMRQAGRYLPEYRELRQKHSMLEMIRTPKLAAEVTLQPIRRFQFDGSIIFADILNPLIGMGIEVDFIEGEGPKIFNPIETTKDVSKLKVPAAVDNIPYTLEAVSLVASELDKLNIPLLGFSGSPFTLSSYMIEGRPAEGLSKTLQFAKDNPESWNELQEKLAHVVSDNLVAQNLAGGSAIQLFDTWVGSLSREEFSTLALPHIKSIIELVKAKTDAPLLYFAKNANHLLPTIKDLGFDALSIDYNISLSEADNLTDNRFPLQGNLDPVLLKGSKDELEKRTLEILEEGTKLKSHIFNLGHGILPQTPPENVSLVRELVRSYERLL